MKSLVVILGLLVAAIQAASGETFSDGPTPLNVYMPLIEGAPELQAPKIVNGYAAAEGQFPHQGALLIDGANFCGCSLITEYFVLTAAHCADGSSFEVILGRLQWNETDGISVVTSNKIVHSDYNSLTLENDIALLRLPASVLFTGTIRPVALPTQDDDTYEGVMALLSGYGSTSNNGGVGLTLNYVDLAIIDNPFCSLFYGDIIQNSTICASGAGGRGPCNGDFGGALVIRNGNDYTQIGIASFVSKDGCMSTHPSAYARITSFLDWIESNTGNYSALEDYDSDWM